MAVEWFRSWHGAPTDSKWLVIARKAGVEPGVVSAIFWALLDHASQNSDRGSVAGFDVETYAAWSGFVDEHVAAVIEAMVAKRVIVDGKLAGWDRRQPARERGGAVSTSAERMRRLRAKPAKVTPDVTDVTPSDAKVTGKEAAVVTVTPVTALDKDTDTDSDKEKEQQEPRDAHARDGAVRSFQKIVDDEFEQTFWPAYPHKVGKPPAKRSFFKQRVVHSLEAIMSGLEVYKARKPAERAWLNPTTFLNQERFHDKPDYEPGSSRPARSDRREGSILDAVAAVLADGDRDRGREELPPGGNRGDGAAAGGYLAGDRGVARQTGAESRPGSVGESDHDDASGLPH